MKDKRYDDFFDEKKDSEDPEKQLMAMVNTEEKETRPELKAGSKVSGTVLRIGHDHIFVELGQKHEAAIKKEEFSDAEGALSVKPGDTISAFIISTANDEIILSKSLSGHKAQTSELVEAMKNRIPVTGKVTGVNKGGFNVTVMGKKAFCPVSHIDLKYVGEPNSYLMRSFDFIVTRVESRGRNIVLSRLPLLEKDMVVRLEEIETAAREKKVLTGTISKIADFGLFVDLGDFEGLVHVSEASWDHIDKLDTVFSVGQSIEFVVLRVERKEPIRNSKISLSIKLAGVNPWTDISGKIKVGSSVSGTITRLTSFGAFVQLIPGIEGLIHISELSWGRRVRHPGDVVAEGQAVNVTILSVDEKKRNIACSLKDINSNPWNTITEKFSVGSLVKGTIASDTKYGFFIDLDENITGLLTHGKIAKDKKGSLKKGDTVEVSIDEIDIESQRISLSYGMESHAPADETAKQALAKMNAPGKKPSSEFGSLLKAAMEKKSQ